MNTKAVKLRYVVVAPYTVSRLPYSILNVSAGRAPNGVVLVLAEVRKHSGELPNAAISQRIITGRLAPFR
jgi:hypothetical protein